MLGLLGLFLQRDEIILVLHTKVVETKMCTEIINFVLYYTETKIEGFVRRKSK